MIRSVGRIQVAGEWYELQKVIYSSGIMNLIAVICFIACGLNVGINIIWFGIALVFAGMVPLPMENMLKTRKDKFLWNAYKYEFTTELVYRLFIFDGGYYVKTTNM